MKANCSISESDNGKWVAHHSGSDLGDVEVSGATRDEALKKMRDELQYRLELCPCTGEVIERVELEVSDESKATGTR